VATNFGQYQYEIYLEGLNGKTPDFPFELNELERRFEAEADPVPRDYVSAGAGAEDTMRANLDAFKRWRIVPKMLTNVETRDLDTSVLGTAMPAPVMLAPIGGIQSLLHPDGELAVARAASELGIPLVLSTVSSRTLEAVAEAMGDTPRWFQLYWPSEDAFTKSLLQRAEAAGYSAIVVTLDTRILAWRPRDLRNAFLPFLRGDSIANYLSDPVFRAGLEKTPEEDPQAAVMRWVQLFSYTSTTWESLAFLRDSTDLPIVLKGIVHPDDAAKAADAGMDGLIVSNHGGRQVDGSIATLDALPAIRAAVPPDFPVLLDSGIRTGADAFKALALGANAVLLGRPYIWALAVGGPDGVRQLLRSFLADLDLTLALSGFTSFADVNVDTLSIEGSRPNA
jgi:isopentenyl diphosphate isomerase/L-lactate dehydrogenase-like FMN-dependent dehydrogenase